MIDPKRRILFGLERPPGLDRFPLFLEDPTRVIGRPGLAITPRGLIATPGNGNFTAWELCDLEGAPFQLDILFSVTAHGNYSNSGIYFLIQDPRRDVSRAAPRVVQAYEAARSAADEKRALHGPGPFELDFFAYEVQMIRGEATDLPVNQRMGVFYDVPVTEGEREAGKQVLHNLVELEPGESYWLRTTFSGSSLDTYVKQVQAADFVPVASLWIPSIYADPVRGGWPIKVLFQAYYNDGSQVTSFELQAIYLTEITTVSS